MSGHSKWSQIKHKKAASDARKSAVFGKLAQAITVAARENPDPDTNLRLQAEIQRARNANMPSESIARALRRGTDKDATTLREIQVEFIGPENSSGIITAITDNPNRTMAELRLLASQHNIRIADPGSVRWMFQPQGLLFLQQSLHDEDLQLTAIDAGATDVKPVEDGLLVFCAPESLPSLQQALDGSVKSARIIMAPQNIVQVSEESKEVLDGFMQSLEDHSDVQKVFTNTTPYGNNPWD